MNSAIIFFSFLSVVGLASLIWGGAPERMASFLVAIGVVATRAARAVDGSYPAHVDWVVLVIDLTLLIALGRMMVRANRRWPRWLFAFHLLGTIGHGAKMVNPEILPWVYYSLTSFGGYPMLFAIAAGVIAHQWRLRQTGMRDRPWST